MKYASFVLFTILCFAILCADGKTLNSWKTRMPNAVVMVSRTLIVKSAGIVARTMNVHSMYSSAIYP